MSFRGLSSGSILSPFTSSLLQKWTRPVATVNTARTLISPAYKRYMKRVQTMDRSIIKEKDPYARTPLPLSGISDIGHNYSNSTGSVVRVPTMGIARSMPIETRDMDNESLLTLAALDVKEARAEMLRRHIMSVDNVEYSDACKIFDQIEKKNKHNSSFAGIPHRIGLTTAMCAGILSFPMCFHHDTVMWFNHYFVTADIPEPKDLETWLEVGSWAWNWMEPPLGQISFFLLCLQFARAQMDNLGIKPYTSKVKQLRAKRLVEAFPRYDPRMLTEYSLTEDLL